VVISGSNLAFAGTFYKIWNEKPTNIPAIEVKQAVDHVPANKHVHRHFAIRFLFSIPHKNK
jgi:hypothetical protein